MVIKSRKTGEVVWPVSDTAKGLECGRCGCRDLRVTRTTKQSDDSIVRERVCRHCGRKIITRETTFCP